MKAKNHIDYLMEKEKLDFTGMSEITRLYTKLFTL